MNSRPTPATAPLTRADSLSDILARLGQAQKSNRGAPAYSRWVNRPAGRFIAAVAFRLGRTPNQVTAVSALLTFSGILTIALVPSSPASGGAVAALLVAGYAFDAADGQLARLRGGGSAAGEWLDHLVDCTKSATIHVAVLIAWFRWFDLADDRLLLVPLVFGVQSSVFFFAVILSEQLRRSATAGRTTSGVPEAAPYLRSIYVLPADYGLLCVVFALLGFPTAFVAVYTALMVINVGVLLAAAARWYREMRSFA